jgi:queuosine precursor transporter
MTETEKTKPISLGLFVMTVIYGGMTVIAGVLGFKQVALGPLAVEAGIFAFLMLVVLSSSIAQLYGRDQANKMVLWGFVPLALSVFLIFIVLGLPASDKMPPENLSAFETVLGQTPRIMAAGPVAYGVSLFLNVYIFDKLRGTGGEGSIWMMVRGGIASAISQAIDSVIFITLAFYGEFPIGPLLAGQILAKVVLSIILVPPLVFGMVKLARKLDAR